MAKFVSLVQSGQLRFVLGDALDRHHAIAQRVDQDFTIVDSSAYGSAAGASLYDCGN